jgi:hypothetical protein
VADDDEPCAEAGDHAARARQKQRAAVERERGHQQDGNGLGRSDGARRAEQLALVADPRALVEGAPPSR